MGQITISNQIVVIERARESINLNVIAQQQQQQQKTGFIESKIILAYESIIARKPAKRQIRTEKNLYYKIFGI